MEDIILKQQLLPPSPHDRLALKHLCCSKTKLLKWQALLLGLGIPLGFHLVSSRKQEAREVEKGISMHTHTQLGEK